MLPLPDCSTRTQSPTAQGQDYNRFRRQLVLYYAGSLPPNYKCFAKNTPGLFSLQLQAPYICYSRDSKVYYGPHSFQVLPPALPAPHPNSHIEAGEKEPTVP